MRGLFLLCAVVPLLTQPSAARPRILGVAHLAVYVSDLGKARGFYKDFLGYDESLTVRRADGSEQIAAIKINDRQYVELVNEPNQGEGQLHHIALATDDVPRLREYLQSQGLKAVGPIGTDRAGNKSVTVKDPDGHPVEFIEYESRSLTGIDSGKHLPASRIADHAMHVGIIVTNLDAATKFYTAVLGLKEFWRGAAANSPTLSWTNMRVPDGEDYVEFMLYAKPPAPDARGSAHHICLIVPNIEAALAALEARPARKTYARPLEIRTGINRKRQLNLFDPDGTRVELMEPNTIDGKPAPSSSLPPPGSRD